MEIKTCLLERVLKRAGFLLIHDGQQAPSLFGLKPEEVTYFTRRYQWKVDGEFVSTYAVFKYDNRSGFADFEVYSHEPEIQGRQKIILDQGQELIEAHPVVGTIIN